MANPNVSVTNKLGYTIPIRSAFEMFYASREAMGATPNTMKWYKYKGQKISKWFEDHGIVSIHDITRQSIDALISDLRGVGNSDSYVHMHARVIKSFMIYLRDKEEVLDRVPKITMPKIHKKEMLTLSIEDVNQVMAACRDSRETALILLMVDSGLRKNEIITLNWKDIDLDTGRLAVHQGKGEKFRVSAIGKQTKKHLLRYKIDLEACEASLTTPDMPLFQTVSGDRFTHNGFRSLIERINRRSGIKFTPHALRRTFAKLAVKSGMNIIYIQQLMGHENLETTRKYVQSLDDTDVLENHAKFGVVDNQIKRVR